MNLFDIFEGAIDDLEARRIEDLNAKMDDYIARAKESTDPKYKEAMRHEYARAKAERDSYYKINVEEAPGAETLAHNEKTAQSNLDAFDLEENNADRLKVSPHDAGSFAALKGKPYESNPHPKGSPEHLLWSKGHNSMRAHKAELEEHGGGGGSPRQWHNYVKTHRTNEELDTNYTYTVFIDGTKEGTYGSKEEAKAVVVRKKQQAPGRDYTIRPKSRTNMASIKRFQKNRDREIEEAANPAQQAAIAINMKKHDQKPKTEDAKVDRMQQHIAGSEKEAGHSKKDAESIAWATLNKRGYLDNKNKKDHTEEASMDWASHKSTGPKFSGYLKGTDSAPTEYGNKSFGGCEEEMEEGIDGNMTVRSSPLSQPLRKRNFVAKNAIQSGAGKHANQLKKAAAAGRHAKHKGQPLDLDEGDNFLTWAVRNGYNLNKPAVYESARNTYKALVEDCGPIAPHKTYYGAMDESLKKGEYYVWTVYFDDGSNKRIKVTSDEFDPYEYYAKQKKNVVNVDYNWEIQQ